MIFCRRMQVYCSRFRENSITERSTSAAEAFCWVSWRVLRSSLWVRGRKKAYSALSFFFCISRIWSPKDRPRLADFVSSHSVSPSKAEVTVRLREPPRPPRPRPRPRPRVLGGGWREISSGLSSAFWSRAYVAISVFCVIRLREMSLLMARDRLAEEYLPG